jgi:hypothetical protein
MLLARLSLPAMPMVATQTSLMSRHRVAASPSARTPRLFLPSARRPLALPVARRAGHRPVARRPRRRLAPVAHRLRRQQVDHLHRPRRLAPAARRTCLPHGDRLSDDPDPPLTTTNRLTMAAATTTPAAIVIVAPTPPPMTTPTARRAAVDLVATFASRIRRTTRAPAVLVAIAASVTSTTRIVSSRASRSIRTSRS